MDRINSGPHFVDAVLHLASSGGDLRDCLTADCEAAGMRKTISKFERSTYKVWVLLSALTRKIS